jgi:precorrin-2 dehydrogenase/sirohydrochlorin ferrochelatase
MSYMVNLALEGRPALVVGGGKVALRKAQDLLAAKARVTVVAPDPCPEVRALALQDRVAGIWRAYNSQDLEGAAVVIAATGDEEVNARVAADAQSARVPVNVVDRPALCTFTVPATVRRGDLTIAVTTEGRAPALAGVLREDLDIRYGPEYAQLVDLFADLRAQMLAAGWTGARIRSAMRELYRDGITKALANGGRPAAEQFVRARLAL